MRIAIVTFCLIVGAGTVAGQELSEETVDDAVTALRANPFSRPSYMAALEATPLPSGVAPRIELELRATMVAADRSLVDINGAILSTGEEYEGYRVVSISEGRAVLSNGGERLILNVYDKQLGLDDDNDIRAGQ
jgi:hypothetical protein